MSTRAKYEHLLLHHSTFQHRVGSLYEKNPSLKHNTLIQSIARELQRVLATCRTSPFDKTVPEPVFGPPALFCFPFVLPSLPLSPLVLVLVSPMVFPPNVSEPLFLPDKNLLVVPPFISSPFLFCSDLSKLFFHYSCSFCTNSDFSLSQLSGWMLSPCNRLLCPISWYFLVAQVRRCPLQSQCLHLLHPVAKLRYWSL